MRFPRPLQGVRGPRQNSGSIGQRWKRREALASRLVLMGRHHTNPPNPAPNPPKAADTATRRAKGAASPQHRTGANTGGAGNQTPPTPAGPTNTGQTTATKGGHERAATTIRTTTNPPPTQPTTRRARTPRHTAGQQKGGRTTQSCGGHSTGETPSNIPNLEAKPGRANGTAPQGVWESRKPPQHTTGGAAHTSTAPPHTPKHPHNHATTRAHTDTRNDAGTHRHTQRRGHTRQTSTRTRPHAGTHTHANTRPRNDARNTAHTPATQPHRTSLPAHGG